MPRLYSCVFAAQTIANASGDYELCGLQLFVSSEVGDAAEEGINLLVTRGHATDGTGGASFTPFPAQLDAAAGFTCDTLRTAIASGGTALNGMGDGFNVRVGYNWGIVPEGHGIMLVDTAALMTVRMTTTVADDVTMSGTAWVREYGG
jgi:hypothetical protein